MYSHTSWDDLSIHYLDVSTVTSLPGDYGCIVVVDRLGHPHDVRSMMVDSSWLSYHQTW